MMFGMAGYTVDRGRKWSELTTTLENGNISVFRTAVRRMRKRSLIRYADWLFECHRLANQGVIQLDSRWLSAWKQICETYEEDA